MASKTFGKLLPDYGDLDNETGAAPGHRLFVLENDGGVSVQLVPADLDPATNRGHAVFLTVGEAKELVEGLQEAIGKAETKDAGHTARGRDS